MSSNVVVISTDFRRATVKVSPGTYLIDVLDEACRKLNLQSDKYLLKHNNKQLDLSNQLRAYNISHGAKLELVVRSNTTSVVSVALKLPDSEAAGIPNGRLIEKFRSDTTLWKMLRHFESGASTSGAASSGRKFNFTARGVPQTAAANQAGAGQLYHEGPVLNVMGRELSSLTDLQKTLAQVGIMGNVLITLSFKLSGMTLHEAMQQMEQFFTEDSEASTAATSEKPKPEEPAVTTHPSAQENTPQPLIHTNSAPESQDLNTNDDQSTSQPDASTSAGQGTSQPAEAQSSSPGRSMQVFAAPSASMPAAALTKDPESAFQPTIMHAQLHQQRLQQNSVNKRLPSDREIEAKQQAEAAKLASIKEVSIKVRFPDNTSAQWTFGPEDTSGSLYAEVRKVMADPTQPFKLVSPAAKGPGRTGDLIDGSDEKHNLIRAYRLEGRVVATVVWADAVPPSVRKAPFLKGSVAQQAQQIQVPVIPVSTQDTEDVPMPTPTGRSEKKGDGSGVKLPKWLKLPGKK
ncbi:hypothetical protein MCOR25_008093 [Pyricularia grisea]|uniref:TUG ubiquitin-like domain-containing protein n=1 Tax=Pyricularia grisea TaxID=148305 RepID=A0A6P8BC61_PYRGI|nr:uncharacterized protein PgNI_02993 [Pyricularia grisea]KAI6355758.1 hypothetical protein MCOR25_008093 [Pyricularia grisea]TLD13420.1 hypothetical protein PgNI_02993 [Pyricularia grisea]